MANTEGLKTLKTKLSGILEDSSEPKTSEEYNSNREPVYDANYEIYPLLALSKLKEDKTEHCHLDDQYNVDIAFTNIVTSKMKIGTIFYLVKQFYKQFSQGLKYPHYILANEPYLQRTYPPVQTRCQMVLNLIEESALRLFDYEHKKWTELQTNKNKDNFVTFADKYNKRIAEAEVSADEQNIRASYAVQKYDEENNKFRPIYKQKNNPKFKGSGI